MNVASLTTEQYEKIIEMSAGGINNHTIASQFGLSITTTRNIIIGKIKKFNPPTFQEMNLSSLPNDVFFEHIDYEIP